MEAGVYAFGRPMQVPTEDEALEYTRYSTTQQIHRCVTNFVSAKDTAYWIKELFRCEAWKERRTQLGNRLPAVDLLQLVRDPPPRGIGTDCETIEKLIRDDVEALSLWTDAIRGRQGARTDLVDNIHEVTPDRPSGTSREAALRRLNKAASEGDERATEARKRVLSGEQSAHAAAVEMGWRKRREPYADLCAAWRKASEEERARFEDYIADWRRREVA